MNRKTAEQVTIEYMKPIYGFALKRCANTQDTEDLTQDICLKLFRSLLVHDDIEETSKFAWTVAHNTLSNYYRKKQITGIGVCIDDLAEILPSNNDVSENIINLETENKLHCEISYLSKMQRKIVVLYYYENMKQDEITRLLNIPIGTLKWHLFEAKTELKKGMETMRNLNELKFNPIRFELCGTNGSIGTKGGNSNFFRSILSQNIAYCTWKDAKTINEIAEALGVSPVYVESEVEYLYEYCFLIKKSNKYLANILLDETTTELNKLQSEIYDKVAKLFANDLYEELMQNRILDNEMLYYPDNDKNFALWSLIPYIAALSGEKLIDNTISFEEAMTRRPDGGQNIAHALLTPRLNS